MLIDADAYADTDAHTVTPSSNTRSYTRRSVPSSPGWSFFYFRVDHLYISNAKQERNMPGGTGVANYLKDHLHEFILAQPEYRCDGKHVDNYDNLIMMILIIEIILMMVDMLMMLML